MSTLAFAPAAVATEVRQSVASKLVIRGGKKLQGDVAVRGMKNAATPIIAACLLVSEPCIIGNVPKISDVERMIEIMRSLGCAVEWTGEHELTIDAKNADISRLDARAVKSMRSSILFMGPLLSRFHEVNLPEPGGCIIGNRPVDTHLMALEKLGAKVQKVSGSFFLRASGLKGSTIILPEFSVTATENAMMAAVLAEGRTMIKLAAAEPHVQDLATFLNSAGARIQGAGTHTIVIDGVKSLHATRHTLIPDQIEIGTFAVLAALTRGRMRIAPIQADHLDAMLGVLKKCGVRFHVDNDALVIEPSGALSSFKLQTMPYPGFPTDLQAPFGVLATQALGTTLIHDPLFEGRMGYVNELIKMGANAVICDPHRVLISGPTPLYGTEIRGIDLRAGATLVIAALVANGESVLHDAQIIDRGYEAIEDRLVALGADVTRVTSR